MHVINGKAEGIPFSLSRWTDVPISKWAWFLTQLRNGYMMAIDPRTSIPGRWSLHPEETLGMVFWTKDPTNLVTSKRELEAYNLKVHVTATGWTEVEKGAPNLMASGKLLAKATNAFGPENVSWRFSPVPLVPDALSRFDALSHMAKDAGIKQVYLSFLQPNDKVPETRTKEERLQLLVSMAEIGLRDGIRVLLCNEDRLLFQVSDLPPNLSTGICQPPEDFALPGNQVPPSEGCGCVLLADPFTINESCTLGCAYCYASDKSLSDKKRNTTKRLTVLP